MKEIKFTKEEQELWKGFVSMMQMVAPKMDMLKDVKYDMTMFEKISYIIDENLE